MKRSDCDRLFVAINAAEDGVEEERPNGLEDELRVVGGADDAVEGHHGRQLNLHEAADRVDGRRGQPSVLRNGRRSR